ncbi:MAG: hypothetical protein AAF573_07610 [Bacteroidota bacterium]
MKKIKILVAVVLGVVLYSACSNDIDLVAEWKDIPIVYGLISKSDTANYIRIEKAFLDNDKSALDIAQIPDSLYYDNITVQIKGAGNTYNLYRVDGNLEGFPREEGIFANAPNFLYKLKLPVGEELVGGEEYTLEINRGDDLPLVTSSAIMLDDLNIIRPSTNPDDASPVNWSNVFTVQWRATPEAKLFDTKLFLHIKEEDVTNPDNNRDLVLEWKLLENEPQVLNSTGTTVSMEVRVQGSELYQFLANRLEVKSNVAREFVGVDVLVIGAGVELTDYINAGNANQGITSTQIIPNYTNLSEGRGIFSSRNSILHEGYQITSETVDSLQNNPLTRDFNFQN